MTDTLWSTIGLGALPRPLAAAVSPSGGALPVTALAPVRAAAAGLVARPRGGRRGQVARRPDRRGGRELRV